MALATLVLLTTAADDGEVIAALHLDPQVRVLLRQPDAPLTRKSTPRAAPGLFTVACELRTDDAALAQKVLGGLITRLGRLVAYCYNPTCNIDGLVSGYTGPGSKTINPAHATAKLDFRLLPGQRPLRILAALRAHLRKKGFGDIEVIQHSTF